MKVGAEYKVNGHKMKLVWFRYRNDFRQNYYFFSDGFFTTGLFENELCEFVK